MSDRPLEPNERQRQGRIYTIHVCEEHGHQDCAIPEHGALDVIRVMVPSESDLLKAQYHPWDASQALRW